MSGTWLKIAVFIDWQNVYKTARRSLGVPVGRLWISGPRKLVRAYKQRRKAHADSCTVRNLPPVRPRVQHPVSRSELPRVCVLDYGQVVQLVRKAE